MDTYFHRNTAGTTVLYAYPCDLMSVNINTAGAGSLTILDNATTVAVIDTSSIASKAYCIRLGQNLTVTQVGTADITIGVHV